MKSTWQKALDKKNTSYKKALCTRTILPSSCSVSARYRISSVQNLDQEMKNTILKKNFVQKFVQNVYFVKKIAKTSLEKNQFEQNVLG